MIEQRLPPLVLSFSNLVTTLSRRWVTSAKEEARREVEGVSRREYPRILSSFSGVLLPTCHSSDSAWRPSKRGYEAVHKLVQLALIACALTALAVGCEGQPSSLDGVTGSGGEGEPCSATGYCPAGLTCVEEICINPSEGQRERDASEDTSGETEPSPSSNQPPIVAIVSPEPGAVFADEDVVTVNITLSDDRDRVDQLTAFWLSDLDGNLGISLVDVEGSSSINLHDLSPGLHRITVRTTDSGGLDGTATLPLTINSAPSAPSVALSPLAPTTGDDLIASISEEPIDINRASSELSYSWEWYADGVLQEDLSGPVVDAENTHRGQIWELRIAAFDGYAFGPEGSAAVEIVNTLPKCELAELSPTSANSASVFECRCTERVDPDDDAPSDTCTFYNGATLLTTESADQGVCALEPAYTSRGMVLTCTYSPGDDEGAGEEGVSNEAVVVNAPPSQPQVALSPESGGADTLFTCGLIGMAQDPDGDPITYTTSWFVNDHLNLGISSLSVSPQELVSDASFTQAKRGDTLRCEVNADDGFDLSEPGLSQDLALGNSLPTASGLTLSPPMVYEGQTITCSVEDEFDFDGDAIDWSFSWTRNNIPIPGANDDTLASEFFSRDDVIRCIATPNDGYDSGLPLASDPLTIQNTTPSLAAINIEPSAGPRSQVFSCVGSGLEDGDPEDAPLIQYTWFLSLPDGSATLLEGQVGSTLSAASLTPGDTITCKGTPSDGSLQGESKLSQPATIENLIPSAPSPELSPESASVLDTFWCTVTTQSDAEGDTLNFEYRWWVNESLMTGIQSAGAPATELGASGGDVVRCEVRAWDAWDPSEWGSSANVVLLNTPPSAEGVSVSPTPPKELDTLTCAPEGALDLDGDVLSWSVSWTVNGEAVESQGDGSLTGAAFNKGDSLACSATPFDGEASGDTLSAAPVLAINTPPTLDEVALSATEGTRAESLECMHEAPFDPDPVDTPSVSYAWFRVDAAGDEALSGASEPTYSLGGLLPGESVYCVVTPFDSEESGAGIASPSATVLNLPPTITSVSLGPAGATGLDVLTCQAEGFSDGDGDPPHLSYTWRVDGSLIEGETEATLSAHFHEGQVVSCAITPGDGFDTQAPVFSEELVISNAMPTLSALHVSPTDGGPCADYTCEVEGLFDPDPDDTPTLSVTWRVNGEVVDGDAEGLTHAPLTPGDLITCEVLTHDASESEAGELLSGPLFTSEALTVLNTPPTFESLTLLPEAAEAGQVLTCDAAGFQDLDCDVEPSYHFSWWVEGEVLVEESGMHLDTAELPEGTRVSCAARPFDGFEEGEERVSEEIQLLDPTPKPASVTVLAPEGPSGPLVCSVTSPATDDDPLNFTWSWWVGAGPEMPGSYTFSTEGLNPCERVFCRLTVSDGLHSVGSEPGSYQLPIGPPCTDNDPCTDNSCGELGGCLITVNEALCDDGDPCTAEDQCLDGTCTPGPPTPVDDGIGCTLDGCDPELGITHAPTDSLCQSDAPCVTSLCDPEQGCIDSPVADCCGNGIVEGAESCDDANTEDLDGCSPTCTFAPPEGMVTIEGGNFWMGCNPATLGDGPSCESLGADALPLHEVDLGTYFIDRYEVSVSDYQGCVAQGGCEAPEVPSQEQSQWVAQCNWLHPERTNHPMNFVTWEQADAFCAWRGARLPTEAEWEKAARGGCALHLTCSEAALSWPWGLWPTPWADKGSDICEFAHLGGPCEGEALCCAEITAEVGSHPSGASPYGVHDMTGNVSEWVSDWYDADYYADSPSSAPQGPEEGEVRVHRGASFLSSSLGDTLTSVRNPGEPLPPAMGFRCARDLAP